MTTPARTAHPRCKAVAWPQGEAVPHPVDAVHCDLKHGHRGVHIDHDRRIAWQHLTP